MFSVSDARFEELVADGLEGVPPELAVHIENVAVIVEAEPPPGQRLLGLYQGVPLTRRTPVNYSGAMPDRITIYQGPISRLCHSEDELVALVRKVVIHEVAHHFGISDPRLEELGWA